MKRSLFITSFLLFSSTLYASTNISSSITSDTQWYPAGSPYMIQGKIVIAKGATLQVEPGVQVIFQGASALEVDGTLQVQGSAAAPAVFNMIEGGLQSEVFINGGEAHIANAKFLSGVFLAEDAQLTMEGSDITKGSGVYLKGSTTARLKNNKIYGNATGVVLDGPVKATLTFNTLVQNTYGLLVKSYSDLEFVDNSVHDNQREVVNNTPTFKLAGNYWGTDDSKSVQARIQGPVDLIPMKSLKDILRVYIRTQLPVITKQMSLALNAKEKREAKEEAVLLAKLKKEQSAGSKTPEAPPPPSVETPAEQAVAPAPKMPVAAEAPAAPEAPAEVEAPIPMTKMASVKALPAAPHKLKPMTNLPPEQTFESSVAAIAATQPVVSEPNQPANAPEVPQPPTAAASTSESVIPPAPDVDMTMPPSASSTQSGVGSSNPPPVPPESSASNQALPPIPPETSTGNQAPPSADMGNLAPPDIETSTTPPAAATDSTTKPASSETVPPPPDLSEQLPPSSTAPSVVPPPPAPAADDLTTAAPPAPPPPSAPATVEPSVDQQKAVQKLEGVNGDIDGMQAPPLDLGPDLSNNPSADDLLGTGQPSTKDKGTKSPASTDKKLPSDSDLALPPLKDADVAPPKDLDLPPMDDLGNINLDSRNK